MVTMQPQSHPHPAAPRTEDARQYRVRVRGKTFLWGSSGITADAKITPAPVLHILNDRVGEPITIGTRKAGGAEKTLGTIGPGEHFSIELHDISGVFAECDFQSRVACAIDRT
jgi:hypothetical protein